MTDKFLVYYSYLNKKYYWTTKNNFVGVKPILLTPDFSTAIDVTHKLNKTITD